MAVLPPSLVVTVTVADPTFTPVTVPSLETVATVGSDVLKVTCLFAESAGLICTFNAVDAPTARLIELFSKLTPTTLLGQ